MRQENQDVCYLHAEQHRTEQNTAEHKDDSSRTQTEDSSF